MSGWIKVDKDLIGSVRFRRFCKQFARNASRNVTECDVTMLFGGALRLWIYADSHIRDDNTLGVTLEEIDELVGVPGFAAAMPEDWLKVIDENQVELPDFIEHNRTQVKQRSSAAARQARYRERFKSQEVTRNETSRNARDALRPDHTRPYQTIPTPQHTPVTTVTTETPRAARSVGTRLSKDFDLSPEREAYARSVGVSDPQTTFTEFQNYWMARSRDATKLDWDRTWQNWCIRNGRDNRRRAEPRKTRFDELMEKIDAA